MRISGVLARLFRHEGSLSDQVVRGGIWTFTLRIADRVLGLVRLAVLARLLAPFDFGLLGIALLVESGFRIFSMTALRRALIQKQEGAEEYLDTAWTVLVFRSGLVAATMFLLAPPIATFFGEPRAVWVIRAVGLMVVLDDVSNTGVVYLQKELDFRKEFLYRFSGTVADVAVAIPAAFLLRSVWALVLGIAAGKLVRCIMSYVLSPYGVRLKFDYDQWKELYHFGKWLVAAGILHWISLQGDSIVVGRLLGAAALGLYQMAFRVSNLVSTEVTNAVNAVTLPAYAKVQDRADRVRAGLHRTLEVTASVTIPITVLLFILAADLVYVVFGEQWIPMVPALQILAFAGLARALTSDAVFVGTGRPNFAFWIRLFRVVALFASIFPLADRWGMVGVAVAVVLSRIVGVIGWTVAARRTTGASYLELWRPLHAATVSALLMGAAAFTVSSAWEGPNVVSLLVAGTVGCAVYFLVGHWFWTRNRTGPIRVLQLLRTAVLGA